MRWGHISFEKLKNRSEQDESGNGNSFIETIRIHLHVMANDSSLCAKWARLKCATESIVCQIVIISSVIYSNPFSGPIKLSLDDIFRARATDDVSFFRRFHPHFALFTRCPLLMPIGELADGSQTANTLNQKSHFSFWQSRPHSAPLLSTNFL